jgi:hypothetical protein
MIFFEFIDICKDFFEIIYPGMKYDFLEDEDSNLIEVLV